jgi:hypothetical protein
MPAGSGFWHPEFDWARHADGEQGSRLGARTITRTAGRRSDGEQGPQPDARTVARTAGQHADGDQEIPARRTDGNQDRRPACGR